MDRPWRHGWGRLAHTRGQALHDGLEGGAMGLTGGQPSQHARHSSMRRARGGQPAAGLSLGEGAGVGTSGTLRSKRGAGLGCMKPSTCTKA